MERILDMVDVTMILEAAITIASLFAHPAPVTTCHAGTVSYKFVGTAGTTFQYEGKQYAVPASGAIELIGHGGATSYQAENKQLPLDVWPIDSFGTRTVPLPSVRAEAPAPVNNTNPTETTVNAVN
jgi:hypothetical protein